MNNAALQTQLKSLKLSGMAEGLDLRLMEAGQNQLGYSEFLSMLLTDELEKRNHRRFKRLIHQAGLIQDQTLESFDFTFNPSIPAALIRELATGRFLEKGSNIFFTGPTGTGKTHLAKAIAHAICRKYLSVRFFTFQQFFELLSASDLNNQLSKIMKQLIKTDLIIIDDFAFKKLNDRQSEYFYAIVNERYTVKSMILTSNRALVDWNGIFPDPLIANTILDRLAHNAYQITMKGESYRKHLRPGILNS